VDGMKGLPTNGGMRIMQTSHQQGPYATTTLVEPSQTNGSSGHHSNTVNDRVYFMCYILFHGSQHPPGFRAPLGQKLESFNEKKKAAQIRTRMGA
jgi:hypothetical protein